jgi:hypothetical protein
MDELTKLIEQAEAARETSRRELDVALAAFGERPRDAGLRKRVSAARKALDEANAHVEELRGAIDATAAKRTAQANQLAYSALERARGRVAERADRQAVLTRELMAQLDEVGITFAKLAALAEDQRGDTAAIVRAGIQNVGREGGKLAEAVDVASLAPLRGHIVNSLYASQIAAGLITPSPIAGDAESALSENRKRLDAILDRALQAARGTLLKEAP